MRNKGTNRRLEAFDDEKRMQRFYAILLEADLACLSDILEKRRKH